MHSRERAARLGCEVGGLAHALAFVENDAPPTHAEQNFGAMMRVPTQLTRLCNHGVICGENNVQRGEVLRIELLLVRSLRIEGVPNADAQMTFFDALVHFVSPLGEETQRHDDQRGARQGDGGSVRG